MFFHWDDPATVSIGSVPRIARSFGDAAGLLRNAGIHVEFLIIPSKFRIFRDKLPPGRPFPPSAEQRLRVFLEQLQQNGAAARDISAMLLERRRANPQDQLWFRADTHWTPLAAQLAAEATARSLRAAVSFPPARGPGARLGPPVTATRTRLDLLEFIPRADRAAYSVETYTVRQVIPGRGGLLDAPPSDVTVVGNSFVAPEFNFSNELSAALDRPVALEWKVQTVGPFKTMLDYVGSQTFRRERPRAIVWVMLEANANLAPENRGAFPQSHMTSAEFLEQLGRALSASPPAPARR